MKVTALAGGTGSARLLRGLSKSGVDLTVVCNVGDNIWIHGLYVCPDLDIATYTLSGVSDHAKGWGLEGDTFNVMTHLESIGGMTWFRLGDRDLATCLLRTELLRTGQTLTRVTETIGRAFGVNARLLPSTDDEVETTVVTDEGKMHLQDFWVRREGAPEVLGVEYSGATLSRPTDEVKEAILHAQKVILCPANPLTSIGPILAIPGMTGLLGETLARKVAVSPMRGDQAFSGPAGKMMKSMGVETNSVGVASLYSGFLDSMLIDSGDSSMAPRIQKLGVSPLPRDTQMSDLDAEVRLAKEALEA